MRLCKGGHQERIRVGAGERPWITIQITSPDTAKDRFERLRKMAAALVASGKQSEAPRLIAEAARVAANPKALAGFERAVRDLCATVAGALDKPLTMSDLCHLYTSGELQRRYPGDVDVRGKTDKTRENERRRLKLLCDHRDERGRAFGDLAVCDVTRADANQAMKAVPASASLGWRRSHSQPLMHLLDIACLQMDLIPNNPLPRKWAGRHNVPAMTSILYPKEEARLAAAAGVDLDNRVMWGVQVREGLRPGAVAALRRSELDLEAGTITHRHKTKTYRMWPLGADVVRVLAWWLEHRPDPEFVFPHVARGRWVNVARQFRQALLTAGIDRDALHEAACAGKRPIRAHDLRTTFVTVAFADGRPESWISARTGHTTATQLARYKRVAETLESLNMGWFAPLDELLGVGSGVGSNLKSSGKKPVRESSACSLKGSHKGARAAKTCTEPPPGNPNGPETGSHPGGGGIISPTAPGLDEESLRALLALATQAKQWGLVAKVGGQLEEHERVRAATADPKVASLDAARAKRERSK